MKFFLLLFFLYGVVNSEKSTCPLIGIAYKGFDVVKSVNVESWSECGRFCNGLYLPTECLFWSYKESERRCYMKTSDDGIVAEDGLVSGDSECFWILSMCWLTSQDRMEFILGFKFQYFYDKRKLFYVMIYQWYISRLHYVVFFFYYHKLL